MKKSKFKLSEITKSIFDGKHGGCDEEPDSGYYFISVKDINNGDIDYKNAKQISKKDFDEIYKRTNLEVGDIIYANSGHTIGKSVYIKENKFVNNTAFQKSVAVIKANDKVDSRYLYYLLKYNTPYLKALATGSAQKNLLLDTMRNFVVEIPEKEKQLEIVKILRNIDDRIEINNKIRNELEELLKTMYNYWFLQFDFLNEEGKPYKFSGGELVWNTELKRKIPENWKVKTLDHIAEQVNGFAFSSNDYVSKGEYKLYTIKNVQDGEIISKVDNYINELPSKMNLECLLSTSDIIMSLTGNVGRIGLVYEENALLNQRVLKLKEKNVSKEFLYSLLRNDVMKQQIEKIASGTSQKNLSPIELGKIKILVPPTKILKKFNNLTNNFINTIVLNYQENEELKSLRDFLLPFLMDGQIKL